MDRNLYGWNNAGNWEYFHILKHLNKFHTTIKFRYFDTEMNDWWTELQFKPSVLHKIQYSFASALNQKTILNLFAVVVIVLSGYSLKIPD